MHLIGGWSDGGLSHSKEQATNYFALKECKAAGLPPAPFQCMSVLNK